jgi:serine/threonine-protein kinase ATR
MDHLNKWVRLVRQEIGKKRADSKRVRSLTLSATEEQLVRVDSMVSSIDQNLMARAALRCKAYARALMSFEQQVITIQNSADTDTLSDHYERLHEIYAQLDEPDGMDGITTLILAPSLEHQIRQHESTGRWTAAQSCWEVQLQRSPDDLRSHLGLLRCLRNIGHYGTFWNPF